MKTAEYQGIVVVLFVVAFFVLIMISGCSNQYVLPNNDTVSNLPPINNNNVVDAMLRINNYVAMNNLTCYMSQTYCDTIRSPIYNCCIICFNETSDGLRTTFDVCSS